MKKILYLSIIGLLSFIIAYIVEILLIPYFAQNNLWNSVKQTAPEAIFFKLPENNPIMRTNDPAFEVLTCRFNLNNAPIKIQTKNSDAFWTIAIFNKNGERFFSNNKSLNTKENLNYILANPVQIAELNQQKTNKNNLIISTDVNEGFILLRILKLKDNWQEEINSFITSAICEQFYPH